MVEYSKEVNGIKHLVYSDEGEGQNLEYTLWDSQREVLSEFVSGEHQIVDMRAGYRAGKSVTGARGIIKCAWDLPNSRWLTMSESFAEGWNTTYRVLFEQLPGYDGDDVESSPIVAEFRRQDKILKLTNGSVIVLGSAAKADRHKGDEFSGIWCDEVAFYNDLYNLTSMLLSRLSASQGPLSMLWTTTTNGYNDYYYVTEEGIDADGEVLSWDIKTVTADSRNNPFLSKEARDNLKQTHKNNKAEGLLGGFSSAEGRVYEEFTRETHVVSIDDIPLVDDWRIYAYDSGWDDPRVILEIAKTTHNQLVVVDEFYKSETEVEDAIDWLRDKSSGRLYSDHEPEHMHKMRKELNHIMVQKANKKIDDGIEKVQDRLRTGYEGMRGLLVLDRCSKTIKEFLSYTKDDVGSSNAEDHTMDCIRYAIATDASGDSSVTSDSVVGEESSTTTVIKSVGGVGSKQSNNSLGGRVRDKINRFDNRRQ